MQLNGKADVTFADGSRLADLINREERWVSTRLMSSQEVFELEQRRLFARAWIPVAFTAELPEPGDFVTRYIGRDPVIVSLDSNGQYHVMLNVCSHRGAPVCRGESGNARTHTCPFHGWIFGNDGRLMGVPFEKVIYGNRIDQQRLGLRQARVGVVAGMIFATWDEEAPPLDEYIGDFQWYLDTMMCRTDGGLEPAGPPQRFIVNCNWKLLVEGVFGDNYHVVGIHRSLGEVGILPVGEDLLHTYKAVVNGHGLTSTDMKHFDLPPELDASMMLATSPPPGVTVDLLPEVQRRLSSEQLDFLAFTPPAVAGIFPSTALLFVPEQVGGGSPVVNVRFFVPQGPAKSEFVSYYLVERDTPQEVKDRVARASNTAFGISGFFEEDDIEIFTGLQRGLEGVIARESKAWYQSTAADQPQPDPVGPGVTERGVSTDDGQWLFYERIFEFLEGHPW